MKIEQLWLKLALAFAGVALLAVLMSSFVVNYSFQRRFDSYLRSRQQGVAGRLGMSIEAIYRDKGGWSSDITGFIPHWAMMNGLKIKIVDAEGKTVANSTDRMPGGSMMQGMMGSKGPDADVAPGAEDVPLEVYGQRVGTLYVAGTAASGEVPQQDLDFRRSINVLMIAGGLLAVAAAVAAGYALSVHLTAPLEAMTIAARKMRAGRLDQRVPIFGHDEIGRLGESLNHLASTLQRQEDLRKQLTADIAHELRTPLASIRSHIEAFQDGVIEATPENIESIHEEVIRLTGLVDDLGQIAQVESGKVNLAMETTDLYTVVARVARNIEPLFDEKNVALRLSETGSELPVRVDPAKMAQVFYNLLFNALKYTSEGGKVVVGAERRGDRAVAFVQDDGMGIADADIPLIFERFYRVDKSRNRATGGSGIGLTVAKELVEAHGGSVGVESEVEHGSVFTVSLPLAAS